MLENNLSFNYFSIAEKWFTHSDFNQTGFFPVDSAKRKFFLEITYASEKRTIFIVEKSP